MSGGFSYRIVPAVVGRLTREMDANTRSLQAKLKDQENTKKGRQREAMAGELFQNIDNAFTLMKAEIDRLEKRIDKLEKEISSHVL